MEFICIFVNELKRYKMKGKAGMLAAIAKAMATLENRQNNKSHYIDIDTKETPQEKKEKKPIGRTPKFNVESSPAGFRVPKKYKKFYCGEIKKLIIQLATDRGELK